MNSISSLESLWLREQRKKAAHDTHIRWGNPDVCRMEETEDKVYYLISIPQDWVVVRTDWKVQKYYYHQLFYELKPEYTIENYCVVMANTVDHPGGMSYPYAWAWVKTTLAGVPKLLNRLGYHIFERLPPLLGDAFKEEVREKAKLHGIDMRVIDIKDRSTRRVGEYIDTYLCFRDDDDACLMRLAI